MTTAVGSFSFTPRWALKLERILQRQNGICTRYIVGINVSVRLPPKACNMLLHCQESSPCIELPVSAEVVTAENSNFVVY